MVCVASGYWLPPLQYPLIDKYDFVLGYYLNNDVVKGNIFCFLSSGRKGKIYGYPIKGTHIGCPTYGRRQRRPSLQMNSSAICGPHEPDSYVEIVSRGSFFHSSRMGC